ncbi:MAG TPA: DUF1223 domain-containing protein [Alphaproteobacteria bacterium]|nr:DUF1223 domain-containing protein [Alphaproteobacteria bacterium]
MSKSWPILCAIATLSLVTPALADTRPVVVELFTSQGCSSCPPADAVLRDLATKPNVIALGFHVDYWDRLGWKDPLSAPGATERQNAYAAQFRSREIYTPQIVVDGEKALVGSRRDEVFSAVSQAQPENAAPVSFAADNRSVSIGAGKGSGTVTLVRFARSRTTTIKAGENAGRSLVDANGVIAIARLGAWNGASITIPIDPPEPDQGIAVLVQATSGKMLGAAITQGNDKKT